MSEKQEEVKESRFEFSQDFTMVCFSIGYSYTKPEKWRHLIHITIMFWHGDFAW